jgi:hypothetical protein
MPTVRLSPELRAEYQRLFVKVDGWAGDRTSDAWRRVTGHYLPADPRGG